MSHPEDIPKLFVQAWNARNARDLADLFSPDAEFVNVVGLWWHNREDIYKAHDYGLKVIFNNSTLELRRVKVKQLSENIAVVHARMRLSGQTEHSGKKAKTRQNLFTFVVQQIEERWVCVSAHNTDIVPGAETNILTEDNRLKNVDYRKP